MRILITGAGGFIGGHLVKVLLAKGFPPSELLLADTQRFDAPTGAKGRLLRPIQDQMR